MEWFIGSILNWKRYIDYGAFARHAFSPAASIVALDDPPHAREPNPGALELRSGVEPLKHAKELVGVTRIKSNTVIAYEENMLISFLSCAYFDLRTFTRAGELEGVIQEAGENLAQHRRVALHFR